MQRAAGDVGYRLLMTVENRRSAAVITLIYCFIAVRRLLAVDGFQLAACAPLMQIKEGKKKASAPHSPFAPQWSCGTDLGAAVLNCDVMCWLRLRRVEAESHFTLIGPAPSSEDSPQIVKHGSKNLT